MQVGRVTAVAWPAQRAVAADLARLADRPAEWPGLGLRDPGPLRLIVVPDAHLLDSLTAGRAPSWGAAIAVPGARTILLRADEGDLVRTLRHELAHLALHEAVAVRVPLWFDEGYASWAAGEWDRLGTLELNLTVVRGAVPTLTGLDGALRGSASSADAAYALAVSAVAELARRNPTGTLTPLLRRLESGEDFDAAVLATTGLAVGRFEQEWQRARPAAVHAGQLADRGRRVADRGPPGGGAGPAPAPVGSGPPGGARRGLGRRARNRAGT